jgi:hypothetical protein
VAQADEAAAGTAMADIIGRVSKKELAASHNILFAKSEMKFGSTEPRNRRPVCYSWYFVF